MSITNDSFASYKLLTEPLQQLGYSVATRKRDDGKTMVTFTSPSGAVWDTKVKLRYPFNNDHTERYSINKELGYRLAQTQDVPIPFTLLAKPNLSDEELNTILNKQPILIVKPTNSSASKGLSLNITTLATLKKAIARATLISDSVLIQEQVDGEEIRIITMKGKFFCALLRRTARITGDGVSTVASLIEKENKAREKLRFDYISYPQLDKKIISKTLAKSQAVLLRGEVLELNRSTMISGGCSAYDITQQIDLGYAKIAERLTKTLGAGFLTIDIFCKDFSQLPKPANHYFIELNTSPALKLFYGCRDGKHIDIIPKLVGYIDDYLHQKKY